MVKVLVTGRADRRVMLALALLGTDVVQADTFDVKPREIIGNWNSEPVRIMPEPNSYGPPVKGRGGKLKRW